MTNEIIRSIITNIFILFIFPDASCDQNQLPVVDHATYVISDNTVTYTCDQGYTLHDPSKDTVECEFRDDATVKAQWTSSDGIACASCELEL